MDKRELFRIGEVARMFHLSVSSLRHYEDLGILIPEYIDEDTGYRYYSTRQFECLNTIRYLRLLNTPLEQIASFLKNRELDRIQDLLQQQKEAVISKQRELAIVERKINHRLKQIESARSGILNEIQLQHVPERRFVLIRHQLFVGDTFDLELPIRQLEKEQADALIFLGKIGVGIAKDHLVRKEYDRYDVVFLQLDPEDNYVGPVEHIPPHLCVMIRFHGSHAQAGEQYKKLDAFIQNHHLQPTSFSREITLIDQGLTCNPDEYVTEIQIPVAEL